MLIVSQALLWCVVIVLSVVVLALARQIGVLHERIAPVGALALGQGPQPGEAAPRLDAETLAGTPAIIGGRRANGCLQLLFFVAPSCPVCKQLLPTAKLVAETEDADLLLVGDGDHHAHRAMAERYGIALTAFVNSAEVGQVYRVGKLPYAVLIDDGGIVVAQGLVNTREHLESLFSARETGHNSVQDYLKARGAARIIEGVELMARKGFDAIGERIARRLARQSSRRSLLAKFGVALVAAPLFPLLPVARAAGPKPMTDFERNAQSKDPMRCDYWRHCALEGILCGCCGGGLHSCPPGAEPSPTAWIGTCLNPDDGRSYLIAYRDCCGKDMCQPTTEGCYCDGEDRNMPVYRPQSSNDIVWCFGNTSLAYHCSTAVLVGLAS